MKKIFITAILLLFMTGMSAKCSESSTGIALSDFSTANPTSDFEVQIKEEVRIPDSLNFPEGAVLYGKVIKVVDGQVGKRTGYFKIQLYKYKTAEGEFPINKIITVKISKYQPLDKGNLAKKAVTSGATTVAGKVLQVPFLSQGVSFVKGAVNADEDENKIVGGVKQVYEDSPLSYVEKGDSLNIRYGEQIKLNFD